MASIKARHVLILVLGSILIIPLTVRAQTCTPGVFGCAPSPPSSPPAPPHRNPVIVVPGFLASLNLQTTFRDREGGIWRFVPPAEPIYRGLIERLEANGYTQGENLFIAHYDWRQPNAESALEYLIPAIEQAKQISGDDKVDIVAHSMGGLVARQYVRSAQYADDVDQLITLGTPHLGAPDAYIAWEGGSFPARWGPGTRGYLRVIEGALKRTRNQSLERPQSVRAFFPSIKELLPIEDFITRDGTSAAAADLVEQNSFLQRLRDDFGLIAQRGVRLHTFAGQRLATLTDIALDSQRSAEDESLGRWRDGHPNPESPPPSELAGDQTVPLTSAHVGTNRVSFNNAAHDQLPERAQSFVTHRLIGTAHGTHLAYAQPTSVMTTLVLSPVDPTITGPGGEVLSKDQNTFTNAEFVSDPTDPNGPKLLAIGNPPLGDYQITLTGTGSGDYTVIASYADADGDSVDETTGTTSAGDQHLFGLTVDDDASSFDLVPLDLRALIAQLRQVTDNHIRRGPLRSFVRQLERDLNHYDRQVDKKGADSKQAQQAWDKLRRTWARYTGQLDKEIAKGVLSTEATQQLTGLQQQIEAAGLAPLTPPDRGSGDDSDDDDKDDDEED